MATLDLSRANRRAPPISDQDRADIERRRALIKKLSERALRELCGATDSEIANIEQRRQALMKKFGHKDGGNHPTSPDHDAAGELWCCVLGRTTSFPNRCRGELERGRGHCPYACG